MVMAPLGIVNAVELTFAAMFVALMIWSLANYLYVSFGHLHMHTEGEKVYVLFLFSTRCLVFSTLMRKMCCV